MKVVLTQESGSGSSSICDIILEVRGALRPKLLTGIWDSWEPSTPLYIYMCVEVGKYQVSEC